MSKLKTYSDQDQADLNTDLAEVRVMLSGLKMFTISEFENSEKMRVGKQRVFLEKFENSIDPNVQLVDKETWFKRFSEELDQVFEINNKSGPEARKEKDVIQYKMLCAIEQGEKSKPNNEVNIAKSSERVKITYDQLSGKKVDTKDKLIGNIGKTSIWDRFADFPE